MKKTKAGRRCHRRSRNHHHSSVPRAVKMVSSLHEEQTSEPQLEFPQQVVSVSSVSGNTGEVRLVRVKGNSMQ
jgi:hypothetical protein